MSKKNGNRSNRIINPDGSRSNTASFRDNLEAFKNIPKLFALIWQTNKTLTVLNILLRLLKSAIPLFSLYIGKLIIDEIVLMIQNPSEADFNQLWWWIMLELGMAFLSDLLNRAIILADALLGDLFGNESSIRLMKQAALLDLAQFENAEFYDKLERARKQTTNRVHLMSQILGQFQDIITVFFLSAGLVVFNPWLIIFLLLSIIPSFISDAYFNRSNYSLVRGWTPERRELDYLRYIGASDEMAKEVKIFGLSDFITDRFKDLAHRYYLANRALAIKRSIWGFFFTVLGTIGYYIAYIFIIWKTIQGNLTIGDLTFLSGSFSRLQAILQSVFNRFSFIAQEALFLQDLFDFLAMKPLISSPDKPRPIPPKIQTGFEFENVGFKYPNTAIWAVRGVHFHLKAGEKLALVGENGAGKTTLVKLLARLYEPDEGRILLDGIDVREYDLLEYRKLIGLIFQDFVKFQLIVSENIAVGKIDHRENEEEIQFAAGQSLADKVIQKLPKGYKQMLGRQFTDGVELSGGEWQKVALGRAYMRDAQLLILDEPTAALDARAEYEVFVRFSELTKGKTAVLISHRFSTVRMADRIAVLKQGKLVEIGSHEALLAAEGLYAELFNLQAEGYK
ncbi:MAG: ABC transporter ATP-binding protein [Microscillaceae bacterium]|nr:ABC transporter ATP-binding protein [Microscillaceae bacterium]